MQISAPFNVAVNDGTELQAAFLVRSFGAERGMLVFRNTDEVTRHHDALLQLGYGYSVIDSPLENEPYDRDDYVALLSDWGWSGNEMERPDWIVEPS